MFWGDGRPQQQASQPLYFNANQSYDVLKLHPECIVWTLRRSHLPTRADKSPEDVKNLVDGLPRVFC